MKITPTRGSGYFPISLSSPSASLSSFILYLTPISSIPISNQISQLLIKSMLLAQHPNHSTHSTFCPKTHFPFFLVKVLQNTQLQRHETVDSSVFLIPPSSSAAHPAPLTYHLFLSSPCFPLWFRSHQN